jgi:hypothetical protein
MSSQDSEVTVFSPPALFQFARKSRIISQQTLLLSRSMSTTAKRSTSWHIGLLVKLHRLNIPLALLRMIKDWLNNRTALVAFGNLRSKEINIEVDLPQGSSLSPCIFVVYHSDLVNRLGAHSCHIFADDLCVLIRASLEKRFSPLLEYLEREGNRVSQKIAGYSELWKQPINVDKTVIHPDSTVRTQIYLYDQTCTWTSERLPLSVLNT